MKKIISLFILLLLLCSNIVTSYGSGGPNKPWHSADSVINDIQENAPTVKKKIDTIFDKLSDKYKNKTKNEQEEIYNKLKDATYKYESKYDSDVYSKNTSKIFLILAYIRVKSENAINNLQENEEDILEEIFGEDVIEDIDENSDDIIIKGDIDDLDLEYREYSVSSDQRTLELGRFQVEKSGTIQYIKLAIAGSDDIDFYKGKNKVKIVGAETNYNIVTSTSIVFGDDNLAYVYFKSPFYIKAGDYKFTSELVSNSDIDYDVFLYNIKIHDHERVFKGSGKKISNIQVTHAKQRNNSAGIETRSLSVPEVDNVIGAFEVYGDEFFFKKLELEIDTNVIAKFDSGKVYLLDTKGQIISTNTGYREDGESIYATFRNVILKDEYVQISVKDIDSEMEIKSIEIGVHEYLLETENTIFPDNYFKGYALSRLNVK